MSQPVTYLQKASHRLTLAHLVIGVALVFVASNFLFALSLRWLPGAILGLGCLAAALIIIREVRKNDFLSTPVHLPFFALCMATGFTLCLLGGQGHIFYSADDWVIRDAVLADMSTSALPAYGWNGETWILRAPLGMYLLPGALGRLAGLGYAISPCDLVSSWRELEGSSGGSLDHYMVRAAHAPTWLIPPPQSTRPRLRESRSCWPDHPLAAVQAQ